MAVHAPEDELAKEMTHDLEMNFNKIAPFGKEDTAKELQDHAAKTQDTLVDAVENAEVAEIKRAVFRALTRLRAATIKEFDTIARLETQAIDAYNDAHHYRAENPLAHLHEAEDSDEEDEDEEEAVERVMEEDYDTAVTIRYHFIQHAVRYYTGEMQEEESDDEEDSDDEEEDSDED